MTDVAIVADVRAVVAHLTELDASAVRVAQALDAWLRGMEFEAAIGLPAGWRTRLHEQIRDQALQAVLKNDPNIAAKAVADGVKRAARIRGKRPDGLAGYFYDLRADADMSVGHWRRLLAQVREHCNCPNVRDTVPPSAKGD